MPCPNLAFRIEHRMGQRIFDMWVQWILAISFIRPGKADLYRLPCWS
jgi:hypothetical protein